MPQRLNPTNNKDYMMSDAPIIAQKAPYPVEVEAGKTYFWCSCGRSAKQPFCDGSNTSLYMLEFADIC